MNERKRQVLLIAQRLFLEKGFPGTSIQDILDEASISKGTFYNYFSSKNECLIAILERASDDVAVRRHELLIGQKITDKHILAEQISIRIQINREHNLLPIFETVIHSKDSDLKAFVKKQHFTELSWLTKRLGDLYGESSKAYTTDCAVLLLGMIQHFSHVWKINSKEELDAIELIHFILRRMDSIMADMIRTKDTFLRSDLFTSTEKKTKTAADLKPQLLSQLSAFYKIVEKNEAMNITQAIQFLIDEIQTKQPRVFLLEPVTRTFRESFIGTTYEPEVVELSTAIWNYINEFIKD